MGGVESREEPTERTESRAESLAYGSQRKGVAAQRGEDTEHGGSGPTSCLRAAESQGAAGGEQGGTEVPSCRGWL